VTAASIVAVGLVLLILVSIGTGNHLTTHGATAPGAILLIGILLTLAVQMWRGRYWAVLCFEALVGVQLLFTALALTVVSGVRGLVISAVSLAGGGLLFWKLIRAMARLQMPRA
jgi:hypothetical protein